MTAPAPNATELQGESQTIAPGGFYAETDGNEETATRGTFVIESNGWQSLGGGCDSLNAC